MAPSSTRERGQPSGTQSQLPSGGHWPLAWKERPATLSAPKPLKRLELRKGLLYLNKTCDVLFIAFSPYYHYPVKHSWQCKQMINRQVLEEMGAAVGSQELGHKHVHFLLPPAPFLGAAAGTAYPHRHLIHNGSPSHWMKISPGGAGRSIMTVGISFMQQQQDEPGMRNQTQNWSWQNIWRGLAARDNTGCVELQMAQNANQQKGFLVLSGLYSKTSSFHPVITQVLTDAQSWEMGLFVSYPPGYRNFYRKVPSFLGSILWSVFDVSGPKKQGRRKLS